jgi:hypothetical protein
MGIFGTCLLAVKLTVFIMESYQHMMMNQAKARALAHRIQNLSPVLQEVRACGAGAACMVWGAWGIYVQTL